MFRLENQIAELVQAFRGMAIAVGGRERSVFDVTAAVLLRRCLIPQLVEAESPNLEKIFARYLDLSKMGI